MGAAAALAAALDPVLLAERAGIDPDPWQRAVLRSAAPRLLLNCSRQSGKSTVTAVLAAHTALYRPGALVLMLAAAERQSKELFTKATQVYEAAARLVPSVAEGALWLELANGSRVVALPGNEATVRGFSKPALVIVDEAARVPDELYFALAPMLAVSRGRLVCLSSPFGQRGFFHREWTEGGDAWERVRVTAHECPRIDPAWLEQQRRLMPDSWFRQEFLCEFVQEDAALFAYGDVMAALSADVAPLFGAVGREGGTGG